MATELCRPAATCIADLFSTGRRRPSNVIRMDSAVACRARMQRDLREARTAARGQSAAGAAAAVTVGWLEARCLNCGRCPRMPS